MEKGEIWLTDLPQQRGKEQVGKRPALIISDTKTSLIIIIPLTSNLELLKYSYTIKINSSEQNLLDKESVAAIFQLRAIDKQRLLYKIGNLEKNYLNEIDKILRGLLKL